MVKYYPLIIGVCGGSGSGKTTLALALQEKMGPDKMLLLSQDAYYKDRSDMPYEQRQQVNYDHPDAVDLDLLAEHLQMLKLGKQVAVPAYDFKTHTRKSEYRLLSARSVIVVEGILIYTSQAVRDICDLKVFVETADDLRFVRRLSRDIELRSRTAKSVVEQYLKSVRPMHSEFVVPSGACADMLIDGEAELSKGVELIHQYILSAMEDNFPE